MCYAVLGTSIDTAGETGVVMEDKCGYNKGRDRGRPVPEPSKGTIPGYRTKE